MICYKGGAIILTFTLFLVMPILILILIIILATPIRKTKHNYSFQQFKHIFVYFSEIYIAVYLGLSILNYFETGSLYFWNADLSHFTYFTRGLSIYSTYQIFVFMFLKIKDSADQDSDQYCKQVLQVILLNIECGYPLRDFIKKVKNQIYDDGTMFSNQTKTLIKEIINLYEENEEDSINKKKLAYKVRYEIIDIDKKLSLRNFAWYSSFLLRLGK